MCPSPMTPPPCRRSTPPSTTCAPRLGLPQSHRTPTSRLPPGSAPPKACWHARTSAPTGRPSTPQTSASPPRCSFGAPQPTKPTPRRSLPRSSAATTTQRRPAGSWTPRTSAAHACAMRTATSPGQSSSPLTAPPNPRRRLPRARRPTRSMSPPPTSLTSRCPKNSR